MDFGTTGSYLLKFTNFAFFENPNFAASPGSNQLRYDDEILTGEISLFKMGMTEEDYTYLCTDVDFIIHAAAAVNLAYPYQALHGPNVLGTYNVIRFACTGKIKPLHYISTNAVIAQGVQNFKENASIEEFHDRLTDGYSQTKWVAERLVQLAEARGLPTTIYRLGNMSGDSKSAYWNPQDFTLILLKTCANSALAPLVDWKMEMTPVDFAAQFIVNVVQRPSLSTKNIFHVINDNPLESRWVFEWMNSHGYNLELLQFQEWKTKVLNLLNKSSSDNVKLVALLDSYLKYENFVENPQTLATNNFHQALSQCGLSYPYTDTALLQIYFKNLSSRGTIVHTRHHLS
ncbi:hypothetical protein LOTGIDRAFT_171783, partial [Lottia gigantea]